MQGTTNRLGPQFSQLMQGMKDDEDRKPPLLAEKVEKNKGGRPPLHKEEWVKPSIVLTEAQQDYLDDMATRLTRKSKPRFIFDRSKLIRSLIQGWQQSGFNVDGVQSEEALAGIFRDALLAGKAVRAASKEGR